MNRRDIASSAILTIFQDRTCHICNHVLSVPPITVERSEVELYRCGRCRDIRSNLENNNGIQNNEALSSYRMQLFEEVARHLPFPCSHQPECQETVYWDNAERHERNCRHRTMKCPIFSQNCSETIRVDNLGNHFKERHQQLVKGVNTNLQVNDSTNVVYLLQADDDYFIIHILRQGSIAVLALKQSNYRKFNVKVVFPTRDKFAMLFEDRPVGQYDERMHCPMCIKKTCRDPHHPFSQININNNQMNLDHFVELRNEYTSGFDNFQGTLEYIITLVAAAPEQSKNKRNKKRKSSMPSTSK